MTGNTRFGTIEKEVLDPSEVTRVSYKFEQQAGMREQGQR